MRLPVAAGEREREHHTDRRAAVPYETAKRTAIEPGRRSWILRFVRRIHVRLRKDLECCNESDRSTLQLPTGLDTGDSIIPTAVPTPTSDLISKCRNFSWTNCRACPRPKKWRSRDQRNGVTTPAREITSRHGVDSRALSECLKTPPGCAVRSSARTWPCGTLANREEGFTRLRDRPRRIPGGYRDRGLRRRWPTIALSNRRRSSAMSVEWMVPAG